MRTVQEVFNLVIENGFYSNLGYLCGVRDGLMCISLLQANISKLISDEECRKCASEIAYYLGGSLEDLEGFLESHHLPSNFEARLAIYKDWENRPRFN